MNTLAGTTREKHAKVLLVEDEALIRDLITEALIEEGFEVYAVGTADEALHRLAAGTPVDILFTDVNLPGGMDGAVLAQRARELRPDLPVMYTSGRSSVIGQLAPVDGSMFLPKPYNPYDVGRLLDYLVAAKKITQSGITQVGNHAVGHHPVAPLAR